MKVVNIDKLVNKIAKLTDNNCHTESVLELAKFVEDKTSIDELKVIQAKANKAGCMDYEWITERRGILTKLLNTVTYKYGIDISNKFRGAF